MDVGDVHCRALPLPARYICTSLTPVTSDLEPGPSPKVHKFIDEGEVVRVLEVGMTAEGRVRGLTASGWVSFSRRDGSILLSASVRRRKKLAEARSASLFSPSSRQAAELEVRHHCSGSFGKDIATRIRVEQWIVQLAMHEDKMVSDRYLKLLLHQLRLGFLATPFDRRPPAQLGVLPRFELTAGLRTRRVPLRASGRPKRVPPPLLPQVGLPDRTNNAHVVSNDGASIAAGSDDLSLASSPNSDYSDDGGGTPNWRQAGDDSDMNLPDGGAPYSTLAELCTLNSELTPTGTSDLSAHGMPDHRPSSSPDALASPPQVPLRKFEAGAVGSASGGNVSNHTSTIATASPLQLFLASNAQSTDSEMSTDLHGTCCGKISHLLDILEIQGQQRADDEPLLNLLKSATKHYHQSSEPRLAFRLTPDSLSDFLKTEATAQSEEAEVAEQQLLSPNAAEPVGTDIADKVERIEAAAEVTFKRLMAPFEDPLLVDTEPERNSYKVSDDEKCVPEQHDDPGDHVNVASPSEAGKSTSISPCRSVVSHEAPHATQCTVDESSRQNATCVLHPVLPTPRILVTTAMAPHVHVHDNVQTNAKQIYAEQGGLAEIAGRVLPTGTIVPTRTARHPGGTLLPRFRKSKRHSESDKQAAEQPLFMQPKIGQLNLFSGSSDFGLSPDSSDTDETDTDFSDARTQSDGSSNSDEFDDVQ